MDATVNVIGQISEGMGGLKESLAAFRKHHKQVGDALLNLSGIGTATGEPVDKDEPRPPFVGSLYPAMMYHADGRDVIVENAAERKNHERLGYRADPYAKPKVYVGDPHVEKKELLDRNRELGAQVTVLTETLEHLKTQIEALAQKK